MLELMFVWIVSALAIVVAGILTVCMTRNVLSALGRIVFIDDDKHDGTVGGSAT